MRSASFPAASLQQPKRVRYLVLGAASFLALATWLATEIPLAGAQAAGGQATGAAPVPVAPEARATEKEPVPAASAGASEGKDLGARIDIQRDKDGKRIITIEKSGNLPGKAEAADAAAGDVPVPATGSKRGDKRVRIDVTGADRDFDSFEQFVESEPALAAMVVGIVAVVFLTPVLAIGLILWYRFRKTRMLNETMLKLAEKGVVPPAQALDAIASGTPVAAVTATAANTPIQEQARQIRRRTAWSDLRRGVLLGGIGLGLTVYSAWKNGTPNVVGLVLLFLGLGYAILWWFEERQLKPATGTAPGTSGTPPTT